MFSKRRVKQKVCMHISSLIKAIVMDSFLLQIRKKKFFFESAVKKTCLNLRKKYNDKRYPNT